MADPKYKDLPGIAYDQADVYETDDLPESDQVQEASDDESESIDRLNINASEAFDKFKGKHVSAKKVDFSDRISRRPRTGYNIIHGEWELPEKGVKETPFQKLRRLQCEIKDLYDEVNELKDKSKDEKEAQNLNEIIPQVQLIGKELNNLKPNDLLNADKLEDLSDNNVMKKLVTLIETFKQSSATTDLKSVGSSSKDDKNKIEPGLMKYEMVYLPEKNHMMDSKSIITLDQRVAQLEKIIGSTNSEKLSKFNQTLKCEGVLDASQQLGTKASLLDSNQLDAIESRVSTLLLRMDNLAQKKSSLNQDTDMEQKICEMYEILKQTETTSHVIPQALERMKTLQEIHQQAARFEKSLLQLEDMESQIRLGLEGNKALLKSVQESSTDCFETVSKNIAHLNERVKKLQK